MDRPDPQASLTPSPGLPGGPLCRHDLMGKSAGDPSAVAAPDEANVLSVIKSEAAFIVAAVTVVVLFTVGKEWATGLDDTLRLVVLFVWLFAVMLAAAFATVRHADALAELLGEPYGTLILTISVTVIEVSVISAVMLNGDADATLARDTMLSVIAIILNGMVGVALLVGGLRHHEQDYNLQGARSYLAVIVTLATVSLILPAYITEGGSTHFSPAQAVLFALITVALYGTFLVMQTTRHRNYFVQPENGVTVAVAHQDGGHQDNGHHAGHHNGRHTIRSVPYHAAFLLLTLVPIVLLSKKLAVVVDYGSAAFGLPSALGGVLIAILVLSPEGLASYRAAVANQLQRSVNICLGSALATIGLTVPAVVFISMITGIQIQLGLDGTEMVILILTLALSLMTFGAVRTNTLQGAVHLVVFVVYFILIFDP